MVAIGQTVLFRDRGATRCGQVVGVERVPQPDYHGRAGGRWYLLQVDGELVETHESDVGGPIETEAVGYVPERE